MADEEPDQLRRTQILDADSADGFRGVWDALVAEDETQMDPDLLCAYAEGRLSDQDRQNMRAQIARSPRAMELLDGLHEQITQPSAETTRRPTAAPVDRMPARSGFARALPSVVAAAMLLCVVGMSLRVVQSNGKLAGARDELAQLQLNLNEREQDLDATKQRESESAERINDYREALVRMAASTKEQLYAVAGSQQPYMTRAISPQLVALALTDEPSARGPDDLSPAEQEQRATQIAAILSPAESLFKPFATGDNADAVLDWVDILIAAGEWEQAGDLLDSTDLAETPESLNLRAGILISEAADLANEIGEDIGQRIEDLQKRAKTLLSQAVAIDSEFEPAWFNLYQLNLAMQDYDDAETALAEYTRLTGQDPDTE